MLLYVIACQETDVSDGTLYWNNKTGWQELNSADVFEATDLKIENLPISGYWQALPECLSK